MRLHFSSSIRDIQEVNDSFDKGILRICYGGRSRNKTSIAKEVIEQAAPTMFNCPVVCNYDVEANEIGGHDVSVIRNENGLQLVNLTDAIGVIPGDASFWWEDVEEDSGVFREYFTTEVILWKRSAAYAKVKLDGITDQSMEIKIKQGRLDEDGFFVIEKFSFTAFCLLGNAEPCFESASLQMYSVDGLSEQLGAMVKDFKESFSDAQFSLRATEPVFDMQNGLEGGEEALDYLKDVATEGAFGLASQVWDSLREAFASQKTKNYWGDEIDRYLIQDYDEEKSEVYCYDVEDWRLYGFAYSMDGDSAVISFDSKTRKKYAVVDYEGGADANEPPSVFSVYVTALSEKYEAEKSGWEEKYQSAASEKETAAAELESLRKFKADIEQQEVRAERDGVFAQFDDLAGVAEFDALRNDCEKYSAEDLTEKCFAIRGRNMTAKFSLQEQKPPKLAVEKDDAAGSNEPYGGVFAKHGIGRKS